MPEPSEGGSGFRDPETSLGGADNVVDTRGVPSHGTEPEQQGTGTARARVSAGGVGLGTWLLIALVIVIAVVYGVWILR